jgi:cyclopropane fatty-acyl-phospholipid synthase-like methyltransferase
VTGKPFSPAAGRNTRPILEVLQYEFAGLSRVLEIGSGTGQHAVAFAAEMPGLTWQTSDLEENLAGIRAWLEEARLANLRPPVELDVLTAVVPCERYDAVYSANTAHIMSLPAVRRMFALVGAALESGGVFCLYGPFRDRGRFNAESNAAFDRSLRAQDPAMGVRELEELDGLATQAGMQFQRRYAMPANNELVVWRKGVMPQ